MAACYIMLRLSARDFIACLTVQNAILDLS